LGKNEYDEKWKKENEEENVIFHSLIGKKMDVDAVFQPNQPFFPLN